MGGLWMAGAGALRAYRGVNETISSLLLNYIAIALLNHMVEGPLRDPSSLNKPSTLPIGDDNMLGNLPGLDVHWGLGFGLIACLLAWFLMQRTTFGFAARMVGGNVRAALLNGLPVRRLIVIGVSAAWARATPAAPVSRIASAVPQTLAGANRRRSSILLRSRRVIAAVALTSPGPLPGEHLGSARTITLRTGRPRFVSRGRPYRTRVNG
jgi:ribose/xylose/arabinose/galactoside ABC-type transport system permease subunit